MVLNVQATRQHKSNQAEQKLPFVVFGAACMVLIGLRQHGQGCVTALTHGLSQSLQLQLCKAHPHALLCKYTQFSTECRQQQSSKMTSLLVSAGADRVDILESEVKLEVWVHKGSHKAPACSIHMQSHVPSILLVQLICNDQ